MINHRLFIPGPLKITRGHVYQSDGDVGYLAREVWWAEGDPDRVQVRNFKFSPYLEWYSTLNEQHTPPPIVDVLSLLIGTPYPSRFMISSGTVGLSHDSVTHTTVTGKEFTHVCSSSI